MNVYSLLEKRLEELPEIQKIISNKDYEKLYENYEDVLNELLFVESIEEFYDFINEQGEVKQESFLLTLAFKRKICCSIGRYEDNVAFILQQYLQANSRISVKLNELNENVDLLVETINKINQSIELERLMKKYIVLFDDTYCEGCFYIFYVTDDESIEDWDDMHIERLV